VLLLLLLLLVLLLLFFYFARCAATANNPQHNNNNNNNNNTMQALEIKRLEDENRALKNEHGGDADERGDLTVQNARLTQALQQVCDGMRVCVCVRVRYCSGVCVCVRVHEVCVGACA
jgi:hypothetical protein